MHNTISILIQICSFVGLGLCANGRRYEDCPVSFQKIGGRCYFYGYFKLNWWRAAEFCHSFGLGASLATLETKEENEYVEDFLLKYGRLIDWTNWGVGQPTGQDQHCLYVVGGQHGYQWADFHCGFQMTFLCEYENNLHNPWQLEDMPKKELSYNPINLAVSQFGGDLNAGVSQLGGDLNAGGTQFSGDLNATLPLSHLFAAKPPVSTNPHQPPVSTNPHQPPVSTNPLQPPVSTNPHQPPVSANPHQPPVSTNPHQPPVFSAASTQNKPSNKYENLVLSPGMLPGLSTPADILLWSSLVNVKLPTRKPETKVSSQSDSLESRTGSVNTQTNRQNNRLLKRKNVAKDALSEDNRSSLDLLGGSLENGSALDRQYIQTKEELSDSLKKESSMKHGSILSFLKSIIKLPKQQRTNYIA